MAKEIERKFLVKSKVYRSLAEPITFVQGYISRVPGKIVRIRLAGEKGYVTIKGISAGYERDEFEYEIPAADARQILDKLCEKPLIEKSRRTIIYNDKIWIVDEFEGENEGLVVAEIELNSSDEPFDKPPWLGCEVTSNPHYYNSHLVVHPFKDWR
jgi:CYTH domain-containing protein